MDDLKQWAGDAYTGEKGYIMEQAVRDKGVITANGTASLEFAREVMLALKAAPKQKIMEWFNILRSFTRSHRIGINDSFFLCKQADIW